MRALFSGFCLLIGIEMGIALSCRAATSGWIDITPRENLEGWTRVPIPPDRPLNPISQWKLDKAHHTIVCEGTGGHEWLRYDHEYRDFIFEVEWRLIPVAGSRKYNSGIFARNNLDGRIWYQAQVGSASGGYWFGDNPIGAILKRFNLSSEVGENHVKPAGEWNAYRLRCVGRALSLWVNGAKQSEFTECNNLRGYIGLEAEGSKIEFRNLKVKVLP